MSNRNPLIEISLFIVLTALVFLERQLHQSNASKAPTGKEAAGADAGIVGRSSNSRTSVATIAWPSGSKPSSQRAAVAGGAGAGKANAGISLKRARTPGVPSEVLEAAETGLPFFLGQIPAGSKELYGFSADDDLSQAKLGGALRMHAITPDALEKSSSNGTVSSIWSETSMWFFPILLEGESKAMLIVDRDGESWKAVSLGYAGLGHELNEVLARWPESKGFHPQLIAVFQAKRFYFTVPEVDDFNLTEIRLPQGGFPKSTAPAPTAQVRPESYGTLSRLSKSLEELKPIVSRARSYATR
jgi:hypothetical protein